LSLRDSLVAQRDAKLAEAKAVVEAAEVEARDITDDELTVVKEAREAADALEVRVSEIDALADAQSRSVAAAPMTASVQVTSEPATYRKNGDTSYFRDLAAAQLRGDRDATDRLVRNDREVRAINTTDTSGGEFVPPLWLVDEYVRLARASRVAADLLPNQALPAGTDSISLPKITTGTEVAAQSSQNSGFQNTDIVTASATSAVHTLGGIQVISLQLLEQSPIAGGMDQVIISDLAADYARALESFVLTSDAAGKRGLLNVPSKIDVTYTDSTPTVAEMYPKIADAIQQIHTQRFAAPSAIVMHPRRWAWFLTALDSTNRPLVVPAANGRFNGTGTLDNVAASGFVGTIQGVDVYVSSLVPTNLGTGTNQDPVLVFRPEDSILFEGAPRAEVFRETYANQGSVLVRMYNYVALATERYNKSVAVINGTGNVAPTF
jgi:HK97 family phage major capsid protein